MNFEKQSSDPETLDDFANRHIAQCSAENIMQWCIYLEKFSMNEAIVPRLAADYHHKRVSLLLFSLNPNSSSHTMR